ncbi:hypothetical protein C0J52_27099 [Blattella germanica]|nr:hypothetical protein C0J52_27099 [Blattella germanica]
MTAVAAATGGEVSTGKWGGGTVWRSRRASSSQLLLAHRQVVLHLGWLVAFLVAVSIARPVHPRVYSPHQYELILPAGGTAAPTGDQALADDGAVRSERSTNLSHITGTARKIQMVIKNRYLQILPDGTVNGTNNDGSDYSE